ncbi:MAG: hypothetical protein H7X80_05030 [bacterium]|nr:hypothetical protein [Candidatus Kapabacteria bacterium]
MTDEKIIRLPGTARRKSTEPIAAGAGIPKVNLADLLLVLECQSDSSSAFVDGDTGEVHLLTEESEYDLDRPDEEFPEWQLPEIRVARAIEGGKGNYLALPTRFEINEYRFMERFIRDIENDATRDRLNNAIHGRGAFRAFKDAIRDLGLFDEWEQFRVREYEKIAIEWCEENGIGFDPAELTWLNSPKPAQQPAQQRANAAKAERLINEPVFTHVTWRAKAGHEREFVEAWNVLGDLFSQLQHPPIEVTLIRSADNPGLFHSIGSWRSLADAQSVGDDSDAIDAIARISELCDEGMPSVYEVVRRVRPQ